MFKVAWQGWKGQDTWEPYEHVKGRGDATLQDFKDSRDLNRTKKTKKKKKN